jgi:hypothetical protein
MTEKERVKIIASRLAFNYTLGFWQGQAPSAEECKRLYKRDLERAESQANNPRYLFTFMKQARQITLKLNSR